MIDDTQLPPETPGPPAKTRGQRIVTYVRVTVETLAGLTVLWGFVGAVVEAVSVLSGGGLFM